MNVLWAMAKDACLFISVTYSEDIIYSIEVYYAGIIWNVLFVLVGKEYNPILCFFCSLQNLP